MLLQTTQQQFADILDNNPEREPGAFESKLRDNSRIPAQLAIEIYANNTRGARIQTLHSIYTTIEQILGEVCFQQIARDYAQINPSCHYDLNLYGEAFSEFIRKVIDEQPAFVELPYLADLAWLEWCYHAVYYAVETVSAEPGELTIDENVSLQLPASLQLVSSDYPIYEIWKAHKQHHGAKEVNAINTRQYMAVYRKHHSPSMITVDEDDWLLMKAIAENKNMEQLADYAIESDINISQRLPPMVQSGWIVLR